MAVVIAARRFSLFIRAPGVCRHLSSSPSNYGSGSRIGFIGLGNMGGLMAMNLLNKGQSLVVYDVFPEAAVKLREAGAEVASSPAEVAEKSETIVSMLPNNDHVREVYTGENGVLQNLNKGTLIIDSSTIDPSVSKEMASVLGSNGSVFMDAPVSGGVNGARAGTLTFMVGGPEAEFQSTKAILSLMGKNIVYCGSVGSGQAAKICNNMLLAITMIGTAETMNLGVRLGLDPKLLSGIINSSTGRNWSSECYNPVPGILDNVPSSNNYQGGFGTSLMAKDLGLAQSSATRSSSAIPLGSLAHQLYRLMSAQGYAKKDFSSIYQFLQELENSTAK